MANVLGTLFSDIANAIREKSGETGTMKPSEFPDKIVGLTASEETPSWIYNDGFFKPESTIVTLEHELGVVPDLVIISLAEVTSGSRSLVYAVGPSAAVIDALGGASLNRITGVNAAIGMALGIEDSTSLMKTYGMIRAATDTTVTVGGTQAVMELDKKYEWIAIGNIF